MKFFLFHLSICSVLAAVWFLFDEPFVDALVMFSSVLLIPCILVLMLVRKSTRSALATGVTGAMLILGFRHAAIESVDAARSEFESIANAPSFCVLNARVEKGVPAWVEDRSGSFSMRLSRFGASNKFLLKSKERIPELRLVPLLGEQQMFRMQLSDCPASLQVSMDPVIRR